MMKRCDFFLPEDLLLQVLSSLPVKSLLRFKCVCKSWYDLLVNPNNNVLKDRRRLIVGHHTLPNEGGDFRILSYDNLNVIEEDFRFNMFPFYHSSMSHPRLMGSYNGLVCFTNYFVTMIAFWNPTTGQSKLIRRYDEIYSPRQHTEHAFGYDFIRNDYRVMRFSPLTKGRRPFKYGVEVYSFNSDRWTNSDADIPDGIIFDDKDLRPTICLKGVYSTMAYTKGKKRGVRDYFLFTIDMGNEEFILTPMPVAKNFEADNWHEKVLIELNTSMAFMNYEEESYTIFILNDYGPNGLWTKLYTLPSGYKYPVGSWKNEILFDLGCYKDLISLNPTTHETKSLDDVDGYYKQVLEYTESLVWVDDSYRRFRKEDKASSLS